MSPDSSYAQSQKLEAKYEKGVMGERGRESERERERNAMCTSGTKNQKEASFALFAKAVRPERDERRKSHCWNPNV